MEWYESKKVYLALSIIVPAIITLIVFFTTKTDFIHIYTPIICLLGYFLMFYGMRLFITGSGVSMGKAFKDLSDEKKINAIRFVGMWIMIDSAILMVSLSAIFTNMPVGVLLLSLGLVLVIVPFVGFKRSVNNIKSRTITKNKIYALFAIAIILAVPTTVLLANDENFKPTSVDVQLNDTEFIIVAPRVVIAYQYTDVQDIQYRPNFDKGRVSLGGFNDGNVASGRATNDELGEYCLTAYYKVVPCIIVKCEDKWYAFNQSDNEKTSALYDQLFHKIYP